MKGKLKRFFIILSVVLILAIIPLLLHFTEKKKTEESWREAYQLQKEGNYEAIYEIVTDIEPRNKKDEALKEMTQMLVFSSNLHRTENVFGPDSLTLYEIEDSIKELLSGYSDIVRYIKIAEDKDYPTLAAIEKNKIKFETLLAHYFEISPEEALEISDIQFDDEEEYQKKLEEAITIAELNKYSYPENSNWAKLEKEETIKNNPLTTEDVSVSYDNILERYELTGTVYNRGDKGYEFIEIKISLLDYEGNIIDTDTQYVNSSDTLLPEERKRFKLPIYTDVDFDEVRWTVSDYTSI
ncbi:FxLYD domain-containing protein (plasmid) [Ureibacillus chungkukjangi]|uniref:FxLYD domain-containing protein n=1 Tax=Ureibacillus chungkukjangi TaxID=1202712 RepID=UPI000D3B22CB|nr:FxLYD domain-containing protein [Ureibacillus chungkukjangi]MCM3390729.1 FxLYD domain-containing protein [Ureibacillus chungkukjangi]